MRDDDDDDERTREDRATQPMDSWKAESRNFTILTKFDHFNQISQTVIVETAQFQPHFMISTKFHNFQRNFTISTKFHNFKKNSQF